MDVETRMAGTVGVVEINRPDRMNSLTVTVVRGLGEAATELADQGARAIVLTGRGSTFCAGADLGLVHEALDGDAETVLTPLVADLHKSIRTLRNLPVPLVAAVEGPAVGAGLGLALCTDLRVVGADARLVPGYSAIGSSPDGGVSYFLARALGPARTVSLLLRNETLDAEKAVALGLVDEVVASGGAVEAAVTTAERVGAGTAGPALLRLRRLVDASTTQGLSDHLDLEQQFVTELWETHDFREGVTAFLERRPPNFNGN